MSILVSGIRLGLDEPQKNAFEKARKQLRLPKSEVEREYLVRRSVDARKKEHIFFTYTIGFEVREESRVKPSAEVRIVRREPLALNPGKESLPARPVIAGFGPAGMFCGLYLARLGYRPLILERGGQMEERVRKVEAYHSGGSLDEESNIQFGEGGAGTFSDGKLTTRINDPRCDAVLADLAALGAPEEILTAAKPHIGTDKLRLVVTAVREEIRRLGGEIRFGTRLEDIGMKNGRLERIIAGGEEIEAGALVLAVGHSARDTFRMLEKSGFLMETKPFSVGVRIEHLQTEVDKALYGRFAGHPALPKGEYQLSWRDEAGRGVYTFCMCPGGYVVPSASYQGGLVTNGMSYHSRDGKNANAALVVAVDKNDFGDRPEQAMAFQEMLERKAFAMTGGWKAPVQTAGRFLEGKPGADFGRVEPTYCLGTEPSDFRRLFPDFVTAHLETGLRMLGRKQPGFDAPDAVMTGPETRTSSPVRILRNPETLEAVGMSGIYPCGEGAGYAGGIMSAAVDGLRIAEQIIGRYQPLL